LGNNIVIRNIDLGPPIMFEGIVV